MTSEGVITELVEFNPSRSIQKGATVPFIDMAAIPENCRDVESIGKREYTGGGSKFKNGDTVFARITPCLENGKTAKISCLGNEEIAHGSTEFIVLAAKRPEFDEDYIYYLARHPEFRSFAISRMEGTSGRQRVSWQALVDFKFPFPEKEIRKRAGATLRALDDKISLNRRINQTLEAMAQAIFKSWFVDFDPVKAKIVAIEQGEDPLRAAMRAISGKTNAELDQMPHEHYDQLAATALLFPDEMEYLELGEIPKGWTTGSLAQFCDLNPASWNTRNLPHLVRYVDLANAKDGEIIEVQVVEGGNIPSRARRILEPGDTIIGTVRPGNRSFAFVGDTDLTGSTGFAALRPKADFLREFVYLSATADENIERLAHLADGGAYPAVRPDLVIAGMGSLPSNGILRAFHSTSTGMFDKILSNRKENKSLAILRDAVLPKLLSGEISIESVLNESTQ